MKPLRILIGGGSGFIGSHLVKSLKQKGHLVQIISREKRTDSILWKDIQQWGLPNVDAVVQLSGAGLFDWPWTQSRKQELYKSRIETTKLLINSMCEYIKINGDEIPKHHPKVFICTSAVGYYPCSDASSPNYDVEYDEFYNGPEADNFGGYLCKEWETVANDPRLDNKGIRKVIFRNGIVLGHGGALKKMYLPFKLGLGGKIASGTQYWPWIHIDDIVRIYEQAIFDSTMQGTFNAVSPDLITNEQFTKILGKILERPTILKQPEFLLKMLLGEASLLLTKGQKVIPKRIQTEIKFSYRYRNLESALRNLLSNWNLIENY
jgi:uncharacterized protein (TIGR01777 family)